MKKFLNDYDEQLIAKIFIENGKFEFLNELANQMIILSKEKFNPKV